MFRCQFTKNGCRDLVVPRLTSSLAQLGNSLLNGQTGCPSNSLLALKLILFLVEAVQSSSHGV